jgi:hypothetical protein
MGAGLANEQRFKIGLGDVLGPATLTSICFSVEGKGGDTLSPGKSQRE